MIKTSCFTPALHSVEEELEKFQNSFSVEHLWEEAAIAMQLSDFKDCSC